MNVINAEIRRLTRQKAVTAKAEPERGAAPTRDQIFAEYQAASDEVFNLETKIRDIPAKPSSAFEGRTKEEKAHSMNLQLSDAKRQLREAKERAEEIRKRLVEFDKREIKEKIPEEAKVQPAAPAAELPEAVYEQLNKFTSDLERKGSARAPDGSDYKITQDQNDNWIVEVTKEGERTTFVGMRGTRFMGLEAARYFAANLILRR